MLLQTEHVSKAFHGSYALRDVTLGLSAGEIHGLVGENGAGKSTLIKLLTGVYPLREGRILWDGRPVSLSSPADSRALGIHVIHQDRTLISTFNCVENAYLGLDYPTRLGRVDWAAMTARVRETAEKLGIQLDLRKTAGELSPPQRTELEIVRAMLHTCRLLILDEPTAALTDREAERLFTLLQQLRREGTAILYVSHRLDEIFRLTDRVSVLRNGQLVDTLDTAALDRPGLIARMSDSGPETAAVRRQQFGPVRLSVSHLTAKDHSVLDGSLTAHGGEILGVFGLGGSGRTELLECIYGSRPRLSGSVSVDGAAVDRPSPADSISRGMVLLCEDRRGKGMVGSLSVQDNILLSSLDRFSAGGVLRRRQAEAAVASQIDSLQIHLTGPGQRMLELSGGNQQKAVFARLLLTDPQVLLCDEPTQAVDVATRGQIHRLLRQMADRGAAVVLVSSDLSEVLEVADTIQIMSQGRTTVRLPNQGLTARQVLSHCYEEREPV